MAAAAGKRDDGPGRDRFVAPNLMRRQLIFDSLSKLGKSHEDGGGAVRGAGGTLLYTWGAGYHGQLGSSTYRKKCQRVPSLLDFAEPGVQVACGGFHNALLTDSGRVYTWGDGRMGQLGNLQRKHNMLSTPHLVDELVTFKIIVSQIACGQYHTACVTSHGKLYSWGSGKHGQLGHGTRLDSRYPREVEISGVVEGAAEIGRFAMVTCGDRHTAAVSKSGKLVSFGAGQHGQLGHSDDGADHLRPKLVAALQDKVITTVDAGATHTAAITNMGTVYCWGFGESLHPKEYSNIVEKPRVVKLSKPAKQVACGQSHILVLTTDGDVWAFGNAGMGQLGHGAVTNVRLPRLVLAGKNIHQIAAGRYHSMAVSQHGVLFSWGCGESGQLAHDTLDNENFPRPVVSILANVVGQVSCGEHHSFCLSSIEHVAVARDVLDWLSVEEEELKLKKQLAKERPNGLKSKDVQNMLVEREKIIEKFKDDKSKDSQVEARHLNEQIGSIRTWDTLHQEVMEAFAFNKEATDKLKAFDASTPVDKNGVISVKPPTTVARVDPERQSKKWASPAPRESQQVIKRTKKLGEIGSPTHAGGMTGSGMEPSESAPDLAATKKRGKKLTSLARRPKTSYGGSGMAHSASAPALEGVPAVAGRPSSAGTVQLTATFHPLAPRMMFMERTTQTLGKLKRHMTSSGNNAPVSKLPQHNREQNLFNLKKQYNALQNTKTKKMKLVADLRNRLKYLKPTDDDKLKNNSNDTRIKDLNMKLVTLNTRLMEAEENKKNYELYIIRMKEEDVQLSKQIDHLRQLVTEYDRLLTKMSRMNSKVTSQKGDLDDEIVKFHQDIEGFSVFAEMQLRKYRDIVESNVQAKLKAERNDEQKRNQREKAERQQRQRIESESKREEAAEVKDELDGWVGKVEYYEKRFHKITAATGLSKPEDIVNKFFFNDEITEDLQKEINRLKEALAGLNAERDAVNNTLQEAISGFRMSKWSDVGKLKNQFDDSTNKTTKDRSDANRLLKKISFVQEGTEQIARTLEDTLGELPSTIAPCRVEPPEDPSDSLQSSVWWAATLEQWVDHLLTLVNQDDQPKDEEVIAERTEALSNFAAQGFLRAANTGKRWVDDDFNGEELDGEEHSD